MPLAAAASEYLAAGLAIIALSGKQPNTRFHPAGLNDALRGIPEDESDDLLIQRVFRDPRTTGIGVLIPERLCVVDVDGENGAQALRDLIGTTDLDQTPIASTGRGLHIWFSSPWKVQRSTKLAEQLDMKGVGGYVAAPPSVHPSGRVYTWLRELVDPDSGGLANIIELPESISALLERRDSIAKVPLRHAVGFLHVLIDGQLVPMPAPANIDGLVRKMRAAEPGNRNGLLYWAARAARDDGVPEATALEVLGEAAEEAGLSTREQRQTIRSAYRARL